MRAMSCASNVCLALSQFFSKSNGSSEKPTTALEYWHIIEKSYLFETINTNPTAIEIFTASSFAALVGSILGNEPEKSNSRPK
jgi:hypothetical protein